MCVYIQSMYVFTFKSIYGVVTFKSIWCGLDHSNGFGGGVCCSGVGCSVVECVCTGCIQFVCICVSVVCV